MNYRIRFETVDRNWLMEQAVSKEWMEDIADWLILDTIKLLELKHNFKVTSYKRCENGVDCIVEA
jgi:hypothetical protein